MASAEVVDLVIFCGSAFSVRQIDSISDIKLSSGRESHAALPISLNDPARLPFLPSM